MHHRLNGWQRIWVVISACHAALVGGLLVLDWPTKGEIDANDWDAFTAQYSDPPATAKVTSVLTNEQLKEIVVGNFVTPEVEKKLTAEEAERVQALHDLRRRNLSQQRRRAVVVAMVVWGLPMATLYFAGWAVAWVRRGFREPPNRTPVGAAPG